VGGAKESTFAVVEFVCFEIGLGEEEKDGGVLEREGKRELEKEEGNSEIEIGKGKRDRRGRRDRDKEIRPRWTEREREREREKRREELGQSESSLLLPYFHRTSARCSRTS
jgi:hypothetical protein